MSSFLPSRRSAHSGPSARRLVLAAIVALATTLAVVPVGSSAQAAVTARYAASWQGDLGPGVTQSTGVMRTGSSGLRQQVHVVRANPSTPGVAVRPLLSNDLVVGRERTTAVANRRSSTDSQVVAATNGDFWWPGYGVAPRGLHIQDNEVMSAGPTALPTLGITAAGTLMMDTVKLTLRVEHGGGRFGVDHVNGYRHHGQLMLYTARYGSATRAATEGTEVVLSVDQRLRPRGELGATVVEVRRETGGARLSSSRMVLSASGSKTSLLNGLRAGQQLTLRASLGSSGWDKVTRAIGGDLFVVRNGQRNTMATRAHPRTAVGLTATGELLMVTVDGRQPGYSHGVTISELGQLMGHLGAVDAINFDGGGSTTMAVRQPGAAKVGVVNRPADGGERAVTSSLAVFSSAGIALASATGGSPGTPRDLRAEALGYRYVALAWRPGTNSGGPMRYQVLRNGVRIATVRTTWFFDRPGLAGTYRYRVRAINADGYASAWTSEVRGRAISGSIY